MPRIPTSADLSDRRTIVGGERVSGPRIPGPPQRAPALQLPELRLPAVSLPDLRVSDADAQAGARLGETIGKIGADLARHAALEAKAYDNARVEDAINQAKAVALELEAGDEGFIRVQGVNAMAPATREKYVGTFRRSIEQIATTLDSEEQRSLFNRRVVPVGASYEGRLLHHVAKQQDAYATRVLEETIKVEKQEALRNFENPEGMVAHLARINHAIDVEADRAGWSPDQRLARKEKEQSEIHLGVIDRFMANRRDGEASAYYLSVKDQVSPTIATKVEAALTGAKERREREDEAERKRVAEMATSDLEISVRRGQAGFADIERAYTLGLITPAKRTQLTEIIDVTQRRAAEAAAAEREALGRVRGALNGGSFLDFRRKEDRDATDLYFERVVAPQLVKASPEGAIQVIADFSARTGIIPTSIRTQIRGALRATDAASRVQAADLLDRLKSANPGVVDDFAGEDIALGNAISTYVRAGMQPEQAVALATKLRDVPPAEREVRADRYRHDKMEQANAKKLASEMVSWWRPGMPAKAPDAMLGEFEAISRAEYMRSGDLEVAQKTALDTVKRTWAVTRTSSDGKPRWMKYAPETVYRVPGEEDGKWIREQLLREVKAGSMFAGDAELQLAADSITARERSPSYVVVLKDKNGVYQPMFGQDGRPLRFRPDFATSPAAERRRKALDEERAASLKILEGERNRRRTVAPEPAEPMPAP